MIKVQGLTKQYGAKLALDNVSFSIGQGEVVGLLGLNGAGKSTTMNILTGYISPTAGTASIDGHDIVQQPAQAKRQIGYLPEQPAFYTDMRVVEYLRFICDLKGVKQEREKHIESVCKKVGIEKMGDRLIRNLSKGYRQRVGFAQALVGSPKVLILDEPTVGLDPSQIIEIRAMVTRLSEKSTIIISSHILSEIQAICGRVIVLYGGRLVADAAPDRLGESVQLPHQVRVRVQGEAGVIRKALKGMGGVKVRQLEQAEPDTWDFEVESEDKKDIRAGIFRVLAAADLPLLQTTSSQNSLEQVFLSLVDEQDKDAKTKKDGADGGRGAKKK